MKNIGKLAVLGAVLAASSSLAFATSYSLASFGSTGLFGYAPIVSGVANGSMQYIASETYTTLGAIPANPGPLFGQLGTGFTATGGTAVDLDPDATWIAPIANSSYVGINANAGPVGTQNPQFGYYEFQTGFNAIGGLYSGVINTLADDTTAVYLDYGTINQMLLVNMGVLGTDDHCGQGTPNCNKVDTRNFTATLANGANTLTFVVLQAGTGPAGGINDPSGVDFTASLTPTPEPGSLMLLGTGLVSAAGMMFRRRATV